MRKYYWSYLDRESRKKVDKMAKNLENYYGRRGCQAIDFNGLGTTPGLK